ncbi:nucleotidyl transferase family protein [Aeoliella mucimassa]|nr:hypothetical protein [Aeoliella mucimassa]
MKSSELELIQAIHASPMRAVIAMTGGGSSAIGELLTVPGGSQTVLDAQVPYSLAALSEWLGAEPEQACCERTARAMAMAAFMRARKLDDSDAAIAGVAVTASLATDRPKRGEHRIHVAYQTRSTTCALSLVLAKGARTREQEETLTARLVLHALAEAAGLRSRMELELLSNEKVTRRQVDGQQDWQKLLSGEVPFVSSQSRGATDTIAIYPGAFNPLHAGHVEIAALAEEILDCHLLYELSIANVDKPPLDYVEIESRAVQFEGKPLLLTSAATFVEKAKLFPNTTFVVGADTIARIGDARYYGGSIRQRDMAIAELAELGAKFLVFGRQISGEYQSLKTLGLPRSLVQISTAVAESTFRKDLSSSELRHSLH